MCLTVRRTRLFSQLNNVILVRLSLESDWERPVVRTVFSKEFLRLVRSEMCLLSAPCLDQKVEVFRHGGHHLAVIRVNLQHAAVQKELSLRPGFHIANFSLQGRSSQNLDNPTLEMRVRSGLTLTSTPTLCEVVLSPESSLRGSRDIKTFIITEFQSPVVRLLQCCLSPVHKSDQTDQSSLHILVESKLEGRCSLSAGQHLGKVSPGLGGSNIEDFLNLQDRSDEGPTTRVEAAEREKVEGNKLFEEGRYEEAVKKYSVAIELQDSDPTFYGLRAVTYLHLEQPSSALADALQAVEIEPSFAKGWLTAVKCCLVLGKVERAKEMCQKIKQLSSNLSSLIELELEKIQLIELANSQFVKETEAGELSGALAQLDIIAQICPMFEKNHCFRAELRARKGDLETCRNILKENLYHCSEKHDVMYVNALLLYYQDNFDGAAEVLRQILSLNSQHQQSEKVLHMLNEIKAKKDAGNKFFKEEKYCEALELYREALKVDEFQRRVNAKLHCNAAACLVKLRRLSEAIEQCDAAISNDGRYEKAFLRRAQAFMETENYEKAITDFKQLRLLDGGNQEYVRLLGEAEAKLAESGEKDLYSVLGVERRAGTEEIRRAYKAAALSHHPDRHVTADILVKTFHLRKFKEVNEAYSVLIDPVRKSQYDPQAAVRAYAAATEAMVQHRPGPGLLGRHPGAGLAGMRPGFVFVRPPTFHYVHIQPRHHNFY